jgi:hypothetical protein
MNRFFNVLVLGGAALSAVGCGGQDDDTGSGQAGSTSAGGSSSGGASSGGASSGGAAGSVASGGTAGGGQCEVITQCGCPCCWVADCNTDDECCAAWVPDGCTQ